MAQDNHDWQIFQIHELNLRRHREKRLTQIVASLRNEFDALVDSHAYAQCLIDITEARRRASEHFQQVELIAQMKAENARLPWQQREINDLWKSYESQKVLWYALQRFTEEQKRIRPNGIPNASATSRNWTKRLILEIWDRFVEIEALWARARASVHAARTQAEHQAQLQQPSLDGAEHVDDVIEVVGEREEPGETGEAPAHAQRPDDGSGSRPRAGEGRKRSRERDDDPASDGDQRSKKSPRAEDQNDDPIIAPEPGSSDEIRLEDMKDFESKEADPMEMFDLKWQAFLEDRTEQDRPDWEKLYHRARKHYKDEKENPLFPEGISPAAREQFRISVNKALVRVLGWDWDEYAQKVKENEDGFYEEGDLRQAELMREAAMQRARDGRSPEWPPAPRQMAPPSLRVDEGARGNSESKEEIARDLAENLTYDGKQEESRQWTLLASIGQGGQGEAGLWINVRFDEHGMVAERVVVKSISLKEIWDKGSTWISNGFTNGENWFRERAMHAQLSSVGSAHGIVQYRGATQKNARRFLQRLYMEYCPHGDLSDILCYHAKYNPVDRSYMIDSEGRQIHPVRIPTRALWTFFENLAAAACVMRSGCTPFDSESDVPSDWEEIIHRDLKPNNIFLASPLAKTGRGIPVCKVGDFGLTVPRDYDQLSNPEGMCRAGTPGWKAPEYHAYDDPEHRFDLSSAVDVWAIGRIMLALIELTPGISPKLPDVRYGDENEGQVLQSEAKDDLVAIHGAELYRLVERCLEPYPDDRITAQQLLKDIHRHLSSPLATLPPQLEEGDVLEYMQDFRWAN